MGNTKKSLAKTLPILTLVFSLTIGSLIALILGLQVSSIATEQKNYLGKTLSSQLAKVVRDPIIRQDMLSLQVEVDEMLSIEGIQHAAVYDATNRPLAKAQKAQYTVNPQNSHTSPITIENAVAGFSWGRNSLVGSTISSSNYRATTQTKWMNSAPLSIE